MIMTLKKSQSSRVLGIITALLILCTFVLPAAAAPTVTSGESIVMDFSTGQILYDGNMDNTVTPSGLVKVMTAILALESNYSVTDNMTVTATALQPLGTGYRNMNLYIGETATMGDLLTGMILNSANDAANVIAECVGGSVDAFVGLMNDKADALGMTRTDFVNPNGLSETGQVSTCHDLAVLLRYALSNPTFSELFGKQEATVATTAYNTEARSYTTRCAMNRNGSDYYYEGAIGGLTGYGNNAYISAVAATKSNRTVIALVAGAESEEGLYTDLASLLNYGFDGYTEVTFAGTEFASGDIPVTENGVRVGSAVFTVANEKITVLLSNERSSDNVQVVCSELPSYVEKNSDMTYYADICYNDNGEYEVLVEHVPLSVSVTIDPVQTDDTQYTGPIVTDESGNPVTDENGNVVTGTNATGDSGNSGGVKKFVLLFCKVLLIVVALLAGGVALFFAGLLVVKYTRIYKRKRAKAEAHARRVAAAQEAAEEKEKQKQEKSDGFSADDWFN